MHNNLNEFTENYSDRDGLTMFYSPTSTPHLFNLSPYLPPFQPHLTPYHFLNMPGKSQFRVFVVAISFAY